MAENADSHLRVVHTTHPRVAHTTPDGISTLKTRARTLHKQALLGDDSAGQRLGKLPEFRRLENVEVLKRLKRRHCLAVVARECGFEGWSHATSVINGKTGSAFGRAGFGTALYPRGGHAHSNIWSASYDEAQQIRSEHGGYLLAYKNQFLVVDAHFIATMGLDPDDPDFDEIGRDWARPANPAARTRLYGKLIAAMA